MYIYVAFYPISNFIFRSMWRFWLRSGYFSFAIISSLLAINSSIAKINLNLSIYTLLFDFISTLLLKLLSSCFNDYIAVEANYLNILDHVRSDDPAEFPLLLLSYGDLAEFGSALCALAQSAPHLTMIFLPGCLMKSFTTLLGMFYIYIYIYIQRNLLATSSYR